MSPELQNKLIEKYSDQFQTLSYIEIGDGWYNLLDNLCDVVQSRIDNKKLNGSNNEHKFFWAQIKEKFGTLRAYCYNADDYIRGAINMAETMSNSICEISGEQGKLRNKKLDENGNIVSAWMKTLSDYEAKKEGYI